MKKYRNGLGVLIAAVLALLIVMPTQAQSGATLEAADQLALNGSVTVARVVADGPSFVVIHADNGQGGAGDVIGFAPVKTGESHDVQVSIDPNKATANLHAMLHTDDNTVGTFEFGTVQGADDPVMVNGSPVEAAFNLTLLMASDQVVDNQVTVARVVTAQPGWLVIHAGDANGFADAIGQTFVDSGVSTNVKVDIDASKRTDILWPMLHTDTGTADTFEFGKVDQTDLPLVINDKVATLPITTVPNIRMDNNSFVLGDKGIVLGNTAPVVVESVLSDKPAFLAIHKDANGAMGDVIGFTAVPAGFSGNVTVNIDPANVTPTVWPVLHADDHTVGTFEYGMVDGADDPIMVNGQPVALAVPVAPFLQFQQKQTLDNDQIHISQALVDSPAFLIIQADDGKGNPGALLGQVPVNAGLNQNIAAALDPDKMTSSVFLTLHTDANQMGVFEPNGVDIPLVINNQPIMGELTLTGDFPTHTSGLETSGVTATTFPCVLTVGGSNEINLRTGPAISFETVAKLAAGDTLTITGQTLDADGLTWWQTNNGDWLRSDVVGAGSQCQPPQ